MSKEQEATSGAVPRVAARLIGIMLAVVMAAVGLSAVPATSASAATCSYGSCDGKDPQTTGCSSGSTTLTSARNVQVRYSSTCKAYWARYLDTGECYGLDTIHIYKYSTSGGSVLKHYSKRAGCGTAWTVMVGTSSTTTRWFQGMNYQTGLPESWTSVITDHGPCTSCESIPK